MVIIVAATAASELEEFRSCAHERWQRLHPKGKGEKNLSSGCSSGRARVDLEGVETSGDLLVVHHHQIWLSVVGSAQKAVRGIQIPRPAQH